MKGKLLDNASKVIPVTIVVLIASIMLLAPIGEVLYMHSQVDATSKANATQIFEPNKHRVTTLSGESPNMVVNPYAIETSEPAPMGIADYGVGPGNTGYEYSTSSFLGTAQIYSLSTNSSGDNYMSFQLNVVLVFGNGGSSYSYWIQDVADVGSTFGGNTPYVELIDNVWNMSSTTASMYSSSISGNGTVSSPGFYYDWASSALPGNDISTNFPITIQFKVVAYISGIYPAVAFEYNDGYGWVTYDNIVFPFATSLNYDDGFVVDGFSYNPYGTFYDAELIMGGPGGGSQTIDESSDVDLQLEYWNGNNYQQVTNAFNFGSDTAEGISNVSTQLWWYTDVGVPYVAMYNSNGSLYEMYDSSSVSTVNVLSGLPSGNLYINNTFVTSFTGGDVNVTIGPSLFNYSYYNFQIMYPDGALYANEDAVVNPGQNLLLNFETLYTVTFTEADLPSGTSWSVTLGGVTNSSSTDTINFHELNGTYGYTIAGIPGYKANSYSGTVSVPVGPLNIGVIWTQVTYSVSFEENGLNSGTLWTVMLGGTSLSEYSTTISFSKPNGTFSFTVQPISGYVAYPSSGIIQIVAGKVSISPVIVSFQLGALKNYGYMKESLNLSSNAVYQGEYLNFGSSAGVLNALPFEAYDTSNGHVYISTSQGITVLASSTDAVISYIYIGSSYIPTGIVYDPVNQYLYVTAIVNGASSQDFYLLTIDSATQQLLPSSILLTSNNWGEMPFDPVYDQNNGYIYVPLNDSIYEVDPATDSVLHVINFGTGVEVLGLVLDSYNGLLYADTTNYNAQEIGNITPVNPSTGQILSNITLGPYSLSVTLLFDPENNYLYAGSYFNNLTVIDPASSSIVTVVHFGQGYQLPLSIAYDPLNNFVYVSTVNETTFGFSDIYVINCSSNEVIDTIPSFDAGFGLVFSPQSQQLYLTSLLNYTYIISTEHYYTVTLTESNLPAGTEWWVNLSNGRSYSSNTPQIVLCLPNGTFSYNLAVSLKTWEPKYITNVITINGENELGVSAPYQKVTFNVKFTETGLTVGTKWYVTVNGNAYTSVNSTIVLALQNGTYNYTLDSISGFTTSVYSGSFSVKGGTVVEAVEWSQVLYKVTFTETGLPSGTTWSIEFDNVTKSSISNTITFEVPNGTYSYIVGSEIGFSLISGKNITIDGSSYTQSVSFVKSASSMIYYIIGGIAGAAVVVGIVFLRLRWKR